MQSVLCLHSPDKRTSTKTGALNFILGYTPCSYGFSVTVRTSFYSKFICPLQKFVVAKRSPTAANKIRSTQKFVPGISFEFTASKYYLLNFEFW